jgi:adenylate cyclase class 2
MLEVEAKFRLTDSTAFVARLRDWGAKEVADHAEADHYLNAPDRDFAKTDEAFRVRRIGTRNLLTYKGPRRDPVLKTRTELETECPPGDESAEAFLKLFQHLGYRPTAVVRKLRRIFEWQRDGFTIHACLDDVETVGQFVELEIVAEETDHDAARRAILAVAGELGLGEGERRSYLELLLSRGTE